MQLYVHLSIGGRSNGENGQGIFSVYIINLTMGDIVQADYKEFDLYCKIDKSHTIFISNVIMTAMTDE